MVHPDDHPAGPALANLVKTLNMPDRSLATLGAYQFSAAASFRISASRIRSATAGSKRMYSCSGSFSRLA